MSAKVMIPLLKQFLDNMVKSSPSVAFQFAAAWTDQTRATSDMVVAASQFIKENVNMLGQFLDEMYDDKPSPAIRFAERCKDVDHFSLEVAHAAWEFINNHVDDHPSLALCTTCEWPLRESEPHSKDCIELRPVLEFDPTDFCGDCESCAAGPYLIMDNTMPMPSFN